MTKLYYVMKKHSVTAYPMVVAVFRFKADAERFAASGSDYSIAERHSKLDAIWARSWLTEKA